MIIDLINLMLVLLEVEIIYFHYLVQMNLEVMYQNTQGLYQE